MTSSVTATMRSPKVVLITFRCRMFFSSTHGSNAVSFVTNEYESFFRLVAINLGSKRRTRVDRRLKNFRVLRNQDLTICEREVVTKNTRLFIGRCRNVDCVATLK